MSALSAPARRVADALAALDVDAPITELPDAARTTDEIASALGCEARQIARTHVYRTLEAERTLLVVASAVSRVDPAVIAELAGERVELEHPERVQAAMGFPAGGVPPLAHGRDVPILLDEELMVLDRIWCPAGTLSAFVPLSPGQLRHVTRGRAVAVG